jgi:membrane protein DedA with SNARE-associated domain
MPDMAVAPAVPSALSALPTAAAVAVLCVAVVLEIVAVPALLLPGGTMTLLAGALIGAGRPALAVAVPIVAAVLGGDQLAYFSGAAVIGWWRRRRPGRADAEQPARRGRAATWLTAAMPSFAGAAGMHYRPFAARMLIMRVPWLAAALAAGTLAAHSLAQIGHVAGIAGVVASVLVVGGLLFAHHRPGAVRALARRTTALKRRLRRLSSTIL